MPSVLLSASLGAFLSVFSSSALSAVAVFAVFCVLRLRRRSFFEPRTKLLEVEERPPPAGDGLFSWVRRVSSVDEEEILRTAGVDAFMYLKFLKVCLRLFAGVSVVGVLVVLPVNATGDNGIEDSIDRFSMANIAPFSERLWAHTVASYAISFWFMFLLFRTYRQITALVQRHTVRRPTPALFTVQVSEIPEDFRTAADLAAFYEHFFPGQVFEAHVARDRTRLEELVAERAEAKRALAHAIGQLKTDRKRPTHLPNLLPGPLGAVPVKNLAGAPVDTVDFYVDEVARLTEEIETERGSKHRAFGIGFVSFRTCEAAAKASQVWVENTGWRAEMAPPPADVFWANLRFSDAQRSVRRLVMSAASFWLIVSWALLTAAAASLASVPHLEKEAPWLKSIFEYNAALRAFLVGFLPTLAVIILMSLLPGILARMAQEEGVSSYSEQERNALERLYYFYVTNVFFVTLVAGSVLTALHAIIDDPPGIARLLGEAVPRQATFFINYTVMSGLGAFPLELLRAVPLVVSYLFLKTATTEKERRDAEDPGEAWFGYYIFPPQLLIMTICLTYSVIAPLILPFALGYFFVAYLVWVHQVVYVYRSRPDSGGKMWPIVFSRMVYGLLLFQGTVIGVVSLKYGVEQGPVLLPLPALTAIFFSYCHNRFRKSFEVLPLRDAAEVDRRRRDAGDFDLSFLEGAYAHPATVDHPEDDDPILRGVPLIPRAGGFKRGADPAAVAPAPGEFRDARDGRGGGDDDDDNVGGGAADEEAAGGSPRDPDLDIDWEALEALDEPLDGDSSVAESASCLQYRPPAGGGDSYVALD